jgi:hypothetical protein
MRLAEPNSAYSRNHNKEDEMNFEMTNDDNNSKSSSTSYNMEQPVAANEFNKEN